MAIEETLSPIYAALYFRPPTETELSDLQSLLDSGLSTVPLLILDGMESQEATSYTSFQRLYKAAFGTVVPTSVQAVWGDLLRTGITEELAASAILNSEAFSARISQSESIPSLLQTLVSESSGITISDETASYYADLIVAGDIAPVEALKLIASLVDPADVQLESLEQNLELLTSSDLTWSAETLSESVSELYLAFQAADTESASEGADSLVVGTSQADSLLANANGGVIRLYEGDDSVVLAAGVDTIVFENSAATNGTDTLFDFMVGSGGDVLDFSGFLNLTDTSAVSAALSSDSTDATTWSNGQILVVQGYSLDTPDEIASLFGSVLALPDSSAKAVIITADIVGDASIWYLVNQTARTSITSDEISLVGILDDVNNLSLVGFSAENFV